MDYPEYQTEEHLIDALLRYLMISKIGLLQWVNFFVRDKIIDPSVLSTDSTLIKAKGHLWHKSSMKKKVVPRSGIDTDARWGFSHTKSWVFGYKLHMVANTGSINSTTLSRLYYRQHT